MMWPKLKKSNGAQRGFSLMEGVMAILMLSIGVTGLLTTFGAATSQAVDAEFVVVANNLANEQMERVMNDKVGNGFAYITQANYPASSSITLGNMTFTRSITINGVATDFQTVAVGTGLTRVNIRVAWTGNNTGVNYSTVFANY